jgi:hypothetical protein
MTAIALKDIPGALVKDIHEKNCDCEDGEGCRYFADSISDFVEKQGEVKIGLNREKLAKAIHHIKCQPLNQSDRDLIKRIGISGITLAKADAIISNLKDLLEVKK